MFLPHKIFFTFEATFGRAQISDSNRSGPTGFEDRNPCTGLEMYARTPAQAVGGTNGTFA